jgi:prolyl 4-hydroxylase
MAWGAGGAGGGGVGSRALPSYAMAPSSSAAARGGIGRGVVSSGGGSGGGLGRLFLLAPGPGPGLPPRVSLHSCVALCVLGFLLGRLTQQGGGPTLSSPLSSAAAAAAAAPPPAALPLPTLPPPIRALASADARHAALASLLASKELNATSLLPEMGPLGRAWLRESGLLALRPPLPPAVSGSGELLVQPMQVLSWFPRIVLFPNFIDAPRRERIVSLAQTRLERSGLAWRPSETPDPRQQARTSQGTFLSREDDPSGAVAWLEEKIAAVTFLPVSHGEAFNVLKYEKGAQYASHMDTFAESEFGPQESQRVATVLTYLTDVDAGGETIFKREGHMGHLKPVDDWADCSPAAGGYRYKPRAGDALLFFSLTPDGEIDPRALHGGCPVEGEKDKWVLTKWIHTKPLGAGGVGAEKGEEKGVEARRRKGE